MLKHAMFTFLLAGFLGVSGNLLCDEKGNKAEDRLLEAELLEVSSGDLKQAMAIYRAILDNEKNTESARARALLYMARCHRKLGQLEEARKLLEKLVKTHTEERKVLRRARNFLRELKSGKADNPQFDWMQELEKNPEIQARIFDLAMDLANPSDETKFTNARRQLLALGGIAVPVLEKMIGTSRDIVHRRNMAIILLHSSHFEFLSLVLDSKYRLRKSVFDGLLGFMRLIPSLGEEDQRRLVEALDTQGADVSSKVNTVYWEQMYLLAGDKRNLTDRLEEQSGLLDDPLWCTFFFGWPGQSCQPMTDLALFNQIYPPTARSAPRPPNTSCV